MCVAVCLVYMWHDVFSVVVGYDACEGLVSCALRCSVSYSNVTWRFQCCCRMRRIWKITVLQCVGMCVVVCLVHVWRDVFSVVVGSDAYEGFVCCAVRCSVSNSYVTWRLQSCRRIWRIWIIGVLQCVGMCVAVCLIHTWHDVVSVVVGHDAYESLACCSALQCVLSICYMTYSVLSLDMTHMNHWRVAVRRNVRCCVSYPYVTWRIQYCRRIWRIWMSHVTYEWVIHVWIIHTATYVATKKIVWISYTLSHLHTQHKCYFGHTNQSYPVTHTCTTHLLFLPYESALFCRIYIHITYFHS